MSRLRLARWALPLALWACGASTELDPDPRGFERADTGVDLGEEDAARDVGVDRGVRDIGAPDLPPPRDLGVDRSIPMDTGVDIGVRDSGVDTGVDAGPAPECLRDRDCRGGAVCVRDGSAEIVDTEPVVLECRSVMANDGAECLSSADCGRGLCLVADTCAAPCRVDRDCRAGQRCLDVLYRGNDRALQTGRACTETVSAGDTVDIRAFDMTPRPGFRVFVPGREMGRTNLTIFDGFPFGSVLRVFDGDGDSLFDAFETPRGQFRNPIGLVDGLLNIRVPSSARAPFDEFYQIEFAGGVALDARELRISGPTGGSVIDFDVFYFPASATVFADRVIPPNVELALLAMGRILESVGIEVGTIRHHPVVGATGRRLTVAPFVGQTHPNLDEARRLLSAGLDRATVPVFWMREIEGVFGTAGNIPGPWGVHGTIQSGIGFAADASFEMGDPGQVLAHELGHFLGLFHTTEVDGSVFDPTDDTPICRDTSGDGMTLPSECPTAAQNLMFWAGIDSVLSEEQAELMRDSLLVQ